MLTPQGLMMLNRRRFLRDAGTSACGFGLLPLLAADGLLAAPDHAPFQPAIDPIRPNSARPSQHPAKASQLLILYCAGGVSHVDAWDYKPELERHHGKDAPNAPAVTFMGPVGQLARPFWKFRPRGESGKQVSDLFPHLAQLADELCFIHSLKAVNSAHTQAENFLSTGFIAEGYPSLGSWTTYALGTPNENLPAFVSLADPRGMTEAGPNNWCSGFLPATFQGTSFNASAAPRNLFPPSCISPSEDLETRRLLAQFNDLHASRHPGDAAFAARIASYELAGRLQLSIPSLMDFRTETMSLQDEYGIHSSDETKAAFARNCLLARRLLESGVRVVQLFNGASNNGGTTNWDSHSQLKQKHGARAEVFDQPAAALLVDLKRRGLLENTLVLFCTEFGRMPFTQANGSGRDHNIDGFTCWLAGAGVKRAFSFGSTDELGWKAVENVATVYDLNATVLHLMGFNHEQLTFRHNGADRRLTDVHGRVLSELLAAGNG
ncbi:MAG TPA: DUF1501 domain-containing protein [Caulifigura sp.]|nr:DUF1501 domain-containing protein [Caulifigura sp.]